MDFSECVEIGSVLEELYTVEEKNLAGHVGSGSVRVLATPWMISFMERTAHRLLARCLPQGYSSVGTLVNVRHLAPTPLGSTVRVRAEVTGIQGALVDLKIEAYDELELAGDGTHQRFIIDEERFLKRVQAKSEKLKK